MKPIQVSDYAQKLGVSLSAPLYEKFATNETFELQGKVKRVKQFPTKYVWVQMDYVGQETKADFLRTFHYYVPIDSHDRFNQKLHLSAGKGEYQITVRVPSTKEKNQFYTCAEFKVTNVNPEINREISYSIKGRESGLKLVKPTTGLFKTSRTVQVKGSTTHKKLLVQLRKDKQVWRRTLSIHEGKFNETIPLLYGNEIHEIKLMLPDEKRAEYYVDGATFHVQNSSPTLAQPLEYTKLYSEKGIHLQKPISSGDQADLSYPITGTIDPKAPQANKLTHIIVQTEKGKEKAIYFLPVHNYRFDGEIWFRFGPGKYKLTLFVPDIHTANRDYFRFFAVAGFYVNSHTQKDLRDMLPSRGIQSDHPTIKSLSKQLTNGESSDYRKAKRIYNFVAKNMDYDMDKLHNNGFSWDDSAIKSLKRKEGVCQDYVFLAIALLRAADIPARFIEGQAGNQRHAWIEAKVGGRWISMDPTWGSGYINQYGSFVNKYDPNYFNPNQNFLQKTHKRTGIVY